MILFSILLFPPAYGSIASAIETNIKSGELTFEQALLLDQFFQIVFDSVNSYFTEPRKVFVDGGLRSIQPRGPSISDYSSGDGSGVTSQLVGPRTPRVYGTGTNIVCGDKLCQPHPFRDEFSEIKKAINSNDSTGALKILSTVNITLATEYPIQSMQLQKYLELFLIPVSDTGEDKACEGKIWIESTRGKLACVFPATAKKLVERGWGKLN